MIRKPNQELLYQTTFWCGLVLNGLKCTCTQKIFLNIWKGHRLEIHCTNIHRKRFIKEWNFTELWCVLAMFHVWHFHRLQKCLHHYHKKVSSVITLMSSLWVHECITIPYTHWHKCEHYFMWCAFRHFFPSPKSLVNIPYTWYGYLSTWLTTLTSKRAKKKWCKRGVFEPP